MRMTHHNGRTRADGSAFSAKHNDRNGFTADHINPNPEHENFYRTINPVTQKPIKLGEDGKLKKSFDEHERDCYGRLEDMLRCEKEYLQICGSVFCMIASATLTAISIGAAVQNGQPVDWISAAATTCLDVKGVNEGFWGMREFVDKLKSKKLARKYIAKLGALNGKYL